VINMIDPKQFLLCLREHGFEPFIGVPCSILSPVIKCAIDMPDLQYITANNEGEALAIAGGAYLAGRLPVVMCQNSGLGNMVNPITSMNYVFRIPVLIITTLRGASGVPDEPQHKLMGEITEDLLRLLRINSMVLTADNSKLTGVIQEAKEYMAKTSLPYAFMVKKSHFGNGPDDPERSKTNCYGVQEVPVKANRDVSSLTKRDSINAISQLIPSDAILVATTGTISRELFFCSDRPGNLYMVGSMGCASSLGLGIALFKHYQHVMVVDGDGAALMRLEAMISIGHYKPENLIHIILDNRIYASTGGQPTMADTANFVGIASACGYATTTQITTAIGLVSVIKYALATKGPHLIHIRILADEEPGIGRPTLTPVEVKERFMSVLRNN